MTQEEWRSRIDTMMRQFLSKLDVIEHKLDEVLYEDDVQQSTGNNNFHNRTNTQPRGFDNNGDDDFVSEEDIIAKGQKVPYNKIVDPKDMDEFKDFITYVRSHEHEFAAK
jgi:hypothetical protein